MASWWGTVRIGLAAAGLAFGIAPDVALAQGGGASAPTSGSARLRPATHAHQDRALQPPSEPRAASAYAVLEKHCARCHQSGRLERPAPAGTFGNILRLDELAAAPRLVQPGNPDGSPLYTMMLRRLMPLDDHGNVAKASLPTADEIAHVRSWIANLPARAACGDRRFVTADDHAATLLQLKAATGEDPKRLRFLSIAHIHNDCARPDALAAYRQAVVHVVNSLSWKASPVAVPPIDPAGTLFKINLDDLGWLPEHWERIMASGSSPIGLTPPMPDAVRQTFSTQVPVARADWFARTVLTAPLYYEVLGLPGTGPEILNILQVAKPAQELRAVVASSAFSSQPSVIERMQSRTGPVWQAYHWRSGEDAPELTGDASPAIADISPPYHAARGMFTLPNGLPGFFVVGQRGDRLDALPPDIVRPTASGRAPVADGLGCVACHQSGPLSHGLPELVAGAAAGDAKATADAMRRIGIDPDVTLDGVSPVAALAAEFSRPLDAARAAAELGVGLDRIRELADRGQDANNVLARRLLQGVVARAEVEARAGEIVSALGLPRIDLPPVAPGPASISAPASPAMAEDAGSGLVLFSDKSRYRKGDLMQLVVRTATSCHLTIVSVDTLGRGTVLFPSDFETNGLIAAGRELRLPGAGAPYALRLSQTGRETIIALCNENGALTDNIRHDFERQRFTDLGDYAAFLAQNATIEPAPESSTSVDSGRGRNRRASGDVLPETRAQPQQILRTAISIVVE